MEGLGGLVILFLVLVVPFWLFWEYIKIKDIKTEAKELNSIADGRVTDSHTVRSVLTKYENRPEEQESSSRPPSRLALIIGAVLNTFFAVACYRVDATIGTWLFGIPAVGGCLALILRLVQALVWPYLVCNGSQADPGAVLWILPLRKAQRTSIS